MKLKPLKELLKYSKEKIDEVMAPIRAHKAKMQAQLEMAKLDEKIATIDAAVQELCLSKDIDFAGIISKLDEAAILERRKRQYGKILSELFPEKGGSGSTQSE